MERAKMATHAVDNSKAVNQAVRRFLLRYRLLVILLFQLSLSTFAYVASFYIRFDFSMPREYLAIFNKTLPLLLMARITAYYYYKIHLGSWRFVSMLDLMNSVKSVALGTVLFVVMMVFFFGLDNFPRSVFILETILNFMLVSGCRFSIRYYHEFKRRELPKARRDVLIAGAGKAGVLVLNEILTNTRLGIRPRGFVDDDPYKKNMSIQGVPVLGKISDIPGLVKKLGIDEVIIAIPSAGYKDIVKITDTAESAGVKARSLPSLGKLLCEGGNFNGQFRDVSCDELLGRKALSFRRESDVQLLRSEIGGKAVLVTGAGGSIGSELSRQVAQYGPRLLILYERYESSLYDLELELRKTYPGLDFLPVIGDILDAEKIDRLMRDNRVELIYHAAAYKHVPMMEREPLEAVRNNVFGTLNVARLAVKNGVSKFVLISTDKAVNPANVMGATKRVAELIAQGLGGNGSRFIAVRFGNVIGSNGSVIPLFKRQISEGGPITITHSDVTRYFMSIPEAVQLVMTAGAMGRGGEIFLLDMGKPVKIIELARDLVKRSGLEPDRDIEIVVTGLRPGEKLTEELYWEGEGIVPTDNKKITMLKPNYASNGDIFPKLEELRASMTKNDFPGLLQSLKEIAPESRLSIVSEGSCGQC